MMGFKIYKKILNLVYGEWAINNKIVSKLGRKIHTSLKPEYVEKFGYKIWLDPKDHLLLSAREYPIHPILKKIIHDGHTLVDVGANIGILTLYFRSIIGQTGKIYSFEPDPISFSILSKNIFENRLNNIFAENKAVANHNGKVAFSVDDSVTAGRINTTKENTIEVDCVSLDEYFSNKENHIDFIKIDTEGYDWSVFEGMRSIIEKNNKLKIMTEFHTRLLNEAGKSPNEFLKIIQDFGFKIYDMGGLMDRFDLLEDDLEEFAKTPNSSNLLCTKEEL